MSYDKRIYKHFNYFRHSQFGDAPPVYAADFHVFYFLTNTTIVRISVEKEHVMIRDLRKTQTIVVRWAPKS